MEAEATKPKSQEQEIEKLQATLNKKLEQVGLSVVMHESKAYFTDNKGNVLKEDDLKKRLSNFKDALVKEIPTLKTDDAKREFAKTFGALKQGGLNEYDLKAINNVDKTLLNTFIANAESYLKGAKVEVGEKLEPQKGEGKEKGVEGTNAYLVSKEKWDELWKLAKLEVIHMLTDSMKEDEQKKFLEVKKTGASINAAGVTTENKDGLVYVYTRTTGEKEGVGAAKGMFGISFTAEEVQKMYTATVESLRELAKNDQADLSVAKDGTVKFNGATLVSKDGKVDAKQYKEFLYVNRNDDEVKEKVRSKMREDVGDKRWTNIESQAKEAYKRDYGPKKQMSVMGLAASASYGVVLYEEQATKKEETKDKGAA